MTAGGRFACVCGELVDSWVRFHWPESGGPGHYVNDYSFSRGGEEAEPADTWPANIKRASALWGKPPFQAPPLQRDKIPAKGLWTPEADLRDKANELFRIAGFHVYDLEQGYREEHGGSRQTSGIGDTFIVGRARSAWVEYKRWDNEPEPEQYAFGRHVLENEGAYLLVYELEQVTHWIDYVRGVR